MFHGGGRRRLPALALALPASRRPGRGGWLGGVSCALASGWRCCLALHFREPSFDVGHLRLQHRRLLFCTNPPVPMGLEVFPQLDILAFQMAQRFDAVPCGRRLGLPIFGPLPFTFLSRSRQLFLEVGHQTFHHGAVPGEACHLVHEPVDARDKEFAFLRQVELLPFVKGDLLLEHRVRIRHLLIDCREYGNLQTCWQHTWCNTFQRLLLVAALLKQFGDRAHAFSVSQCLAYSPRRRFDTARVQLVSYGLDLFVSDGCLAGHNVLLF
jgi:hypothetical protein